MRTTAFLSTPSARRATIPSTQPQILPQFLSTPSARRATWSYFISSVKFTISIHALREEGDGAVQVRLASDRFLSTPSARRATWTAQKSASSFVISIHALREEGDSANRRYSLPFFAFLSTPSARRATCI